MEYDVFISYSSADRSIAEKIREAMRSRSIACWMAPESVEPGCFWAAQIVQAIKQSKAVVVILSSGANQSVHVPREAQLAISHRRGLIPYRIEGVDPEGALEYCLCVTHWLDAIFPASMDPENLSRLCDAVERAIHSYRPDQKSVRIQGLFKENTSKDLRLRLADEMVRQKQAIICTDAFSPQDRKTLEELESLGHFVEQPSLTQPVGKRFTTPAKPEDCLDLLTEWVAEQKIDPARLLDLAVGFPLLLEAIAQVLLDKPDEEMTTLIRSYASIDRQEIENLVRSLIDRSDLPGPPIQMVHERVQKLASLVLHQPTFPALRGLLVGAQRLISRSRIELAIVIYDQIGNWGKESTQNVEVKRLLVETANERARAEIRQGWIDVAERRLRQALEVAGGFEDPILVGVLTNNLARALMERPLPARREEAIRILEDNLVRLADTPQRGHLAAAYNNLGDALETVDPKRAEECFRTDIQICRELKNDLLTSDALHSLANFLMNGKKYDQAGLALQEELALFERFFDPRRHARALANLGRAYMGRWKMSGDRRELEQALIPMQASKDWFLTSSDEPRLFASALENLGRVLFLLGRQEEGLAALRDAIAQYRRLPDSGRIAEEIEEELLQLEM